MKAIGWLVALALLLGTGLVLILRTSDGAAALVLSDVRLQPGPGGGGIVTLAIDNRGDPDRLLSAASPEAEVTLVNPIAPDGTPIPAGTSTLAADGAHLALDRIAAEGALVPVTLRFDRAGEVTVKARSTAAPAPDSAASSAAHGADAPDHAAMGHAPAATHVVPAGQPAPSLAIEVAPEDDGWRVTATTENFTFSEAAADGPHVEGQGHAHLYVGGLKIGRLYGPAGRIGALPPGRHEVRVTLNTNDHRKLVVDGKTVTATAVIDAE